MIALRSLNYWLSKFVQEVAKSSSERYPPRKVNGIIAGIRRYLPEKKPGDDLNLLSTSDNRKGFGGNYQPHLFRRVQIAHLRFLSFLVVLNVNLFFSVFYV